MNEQQRRILAAHIPPRYRGLSLDEASERRVKGVEIRKGHLISRWREQVLSGAVVAAVGHYETCGVGIWATGPLAGAYLTALMRDLMCEESYTGLYLHVDDYLESLRPDGDRRFNDKVASASFVVLANAGCEQMTEWTRGAVGSLILKRYEAGLPTLVAATVEPTEYLADSLAEAIFLRVAIMKVVE